MDPFKNNLKNNSTNQIRSIGQASYPGDNTKDQQKNTEKPNISHAIRFETMKGDIENLQQQRPAEVTTNPRTSPVETRPIPKPPRPPISYDSPPESDDRLNIWPIGNDTVIPTPPTIYNKKTEQTTFRPSTDISENKYKRFITPNPFIDQEAEIRKKIQTQAPTSKNNVEIDKNPSPQDLSSPSDMPAKKGMSPIHTFTSDVADAVKTEHTSAAQISIAENNRRHKNPSPEEKDRLSTIGKNTLMIVISLILLTVGGGIGYYFIFLRPEPVPQTIQQVTQQPDIIQSEKKITLSLNDLNHDKLISSLQKIMSTTSLTAGQIERIFLTNTTGSSEQTTLDAVPEDLFSLIQTSAPDSLIRSLDDNFYFGIYNAQSNGDPNEPFLILTTDSYSNVAAGMLLWEHTMAKDLQDIFFRPQDRLPAAAYSNPTASSTQYSFESAVVSNRDVRVVENSQGKIILLYSLVDKNTLIITADQFTFDELLNRLIKATFVR